jgi:uncharacterized protein YndB with AHSA1/START domain
MTQGSPELILEIERLIPAARPTVFAAFTDQEVLSQWWGPEGFTVASLDFQPDPGRDYRIEMHPPEGDNFHLVGEFREVEPPARLAFTFAWEPPDPDDLEMVATLDFRDPGDSTGVALTLGPFKTEARRDLHREGWGDSFDRLGQLLSAGGRPG